MIRKNSRVKFRGFDTNKENIDEEKDLFKKARFQRKRELTYIVGATCSDGVVLVGDRKITVDDGADHFFHQKLFDPYPDIIMGSAGVTGLFTSFHDRFIRKTEEIGEQKHPKDWDMSATLKLSTEKIIHEMNRDFGNREIDNLEVLLAFRTTHKSQLICYNSLGLGEPVATYRAIGHGEPYGSVLLKTLWNKYKDKPMTTEKFAKLGCLVIEYIQRMKLDNSVGIDKDSTGKYRFPQVFVLPNVPDNEKLDNNYSHNVEDVEENIVKGIVEEMEPYLNNIEKAIKNISL